MDTEINNLQNKQTRKRWKKIRKLLKYIKKIKYTLSTIYDFLYDLDKHIKELYKYNIVNKFKVTEIENIIHRLTREIEYLKTQIATKSIYFYHINTDNISRLSELYITCIDLLEKYGINCIALFINYYFILYSALQDIYYLHHVYNIVYDKIINDDTESRIHKPAINDNITYDNTNIPHINHCHKNNRTQSPIILLSTQNNDDIIDDSNNIESTSLPNNIESLMNSIKTPDSMSDDLMFMLDLEDNSKLSNINNLNNGRCLSPPEISKPIIDMYSKVNNSFSLLDDKSSHNDDILYTDNARYINNYNTPNNYADKYFQKNIYELNKKFTNLLFTSHEKTSINQLNILPHDFMTSLYIDAPTNMDYNHQYIDLLNKVVIPVNCAVIYNYSTRMYNLLNGFTNIGLIQNKLLIQPDTYVDDAVIHMLDTCLRKTSTLNTGHKTNKHTNIHSNLIKLININSENNALSNNIFHENKDNLAYLIINIPISNVDSKRGIGQKKKIYIQMVFTVLITYKNKSIMQKYSILNKHLQNMLAIVENITNIPPIFKKHIIKLIDLRMLLLYDSKYIYNYCNEKWELYKKYRDLPITDCMNQFLHLSKKHKADVISVLLLTSNSDPDLSFKCYTLWDLIVDEANHGDSSNIENEISELIHPELRIRLRQLINVNTEKEKEIINIDENELSYERKIILCKGDKVVKQKAFEKLKEISNKGNGEVNTKAQNYLDALLKIPFNTYNKEWIIQKMDTLLLDIRIVIINLIIELHKKQATYSVYSNILDSILNLFPESIRNNIRNNIGKLDMDSEQDNYENNLINTIPNSCIRKYFLHKIQTIIQNVVNNPNFESIQSLLESPVPPNIYNPRLVQLLHHIGESNLAMLTSAMHICNCSNHINAILNVSKQSLGNQHEIVNNLIANGNCYTTFYPVELIDYIDNIQQLLSRYEQLKKEQSIFLSECQQYMDDSIYGQQDAKRQILRIIAQWLNGNQSGYCLGFEGSPGLGKTSLAKYGISQALRNKDGQARPFGFIALGGSANGSILEGHSYTYVGSTWGRIVDILIQSKCMNPIIFIDELDKISSTDSGRELIGILTHLTDKTQNNEFMDKYFSGIKLDLSRVLFIFSYNDYNLLDSILADRIHRVQFNNYSVYDKLCITSQYLLPRISTEVNITDYYINIPNDVITYIINSYTFEAGVRKLKEKLYDIFREINILTISGNGPHNEELISTGDEIVLTVDMVDNILSSYSKISFVKPLPNPTIGLAYGLYATVSGIGGIMMIQATRRPLDNGGGGLLCTGKQGDVMKESMKVALTLASNLVEPNQLSRYIQQTTPNNSNTMDTLYKIGFHVHCPDGASPKDGPSAGCAITLSLVSLITNCKIRNDISMTGEVDVIGNVLPIGGLDSKIQGSKKAGIYNVMVPEKNKKDVDKIQDKTPDILIGVNIIYISSITEVIKYALITPNNNLS